MSRCLMALGLLRLRHQLHATIKFESHHRRDGDTTSEVRGDRAVYHGEQYINC